HPGAVSFVSRFLLSTDDDIRLEAASALAQCREAQAIEILKEFWQEPLLISVELRRALLISLGASPLEAAAEFLLTVVADAEDLELAETAVRALATSRFQGQLKDR